MTADPLVTPQDLIVFALFGAVYVAAHLYAKRLKRQEAEARAQAAAERAERLRLDDARRRAEAERFAPPEFTAAMHREADQGAWKLFLEYVDHGWLYPLPKEGRERRVPSRTRKEG
jgi:hypothetical protein